MLSGDETIRKRDRFSRYPPLLVCFGENGGDRPEGGHRTGMETRNRTPLFRGLVVDVEQMEVKVGDKGWHLYQVVKHPGGVGVLPRHEDGTGTLPRQLRPPVGARLMEIPAGLHAAGEDRADRRRFDLAEETALWAKTFTSLG